MCGKEAVNMEFQSEEQIADSITQLLRQFTGDKTLPYPSNVLRSKWSIDPYFSGSHSYIAVNSSVGHQCDLASPLPGKAKIFF